MKAGAFRQRKWERALIRAFTITSGTPARRASMIMFGQSSDSAISATSGRQCSKKRRMKRGASSGAYWCMPPGGRRWASRRADVTVPVVTKAKRPLRVRRSIRGSSDRASPTLAPCSQTTGPGGRARLATPRRSSIRSGSSLALLSRSDSNTPLSGVIKSVARR